MSCPVLGPCVVLSLCRHVPAVRRRVPSIMKFALLIMEFGCPFGADDEHKFMIN